MRVFSASLSCSFLHTCEAENSTRLVISTIHSPATQCLCRSSNYLRYTLGETNMRVPFVMLLLIPGLLLAETPEPGQALTQAHKLYRHTDYTTAIRLLSDIPVKDAAVNELLGQCYFMSADYKKATEYLESAAATEPRNSQYLTWLGRVYGRRAETSFAWNAISWAAKSRTSLETAMQLDPANWEALDDLFEFYLQAPGFMGGGLDRAEKLAV